MTGKIVSISHKMVAELTGAALSGIYESFGFDIENGFTVNLSGAFDQRELMYAAQDVKAANDALFKLRLYLTPAKVREACARGGYTDLGAFRVLAVRPSLNSNGITVKCYFQDGHDGDVEGYVYLTKLNGQWYGEF